MFIISVMKSGGGTHLMAKDMNCELSCFQCICHCNAIVAVVLIYYYAHILLSWKSLQILREVFGIPKQQS